jgi:hypothetical protein
MNPEFELCYNSAWPCQCHLLEMDKDQINTFFITICSQMLRLSTIYMLRLSTIFHYNLFSDVATIYYLYVTICYSKTLGACYSVHCIDFERFGNFLVNIILTLVTRAVFR